MCDIKRGPGDLNCVRGFRLSPDYDGATPTGVEIVQECGEMWVFCIRISVCGLIQQGGVIVNGDRDLKYIFTVRRVSNVLLRY